MIDLIELKRLFDKAYTHNQVTRERAADDLVFYWVTQWDDALMGDSSLAYKGEFDILRKAGRQIISDLRANPVQVDFEPLDEGRDDAADLLDGLYLSDDRVNSTIESYDNAKMESVVCGVGAWELYTDYKSNRAGDEHQVIRRRPIHEANNTVFFDPDDKSMDKSEGKYAAILTPYTREGYRKLVEELTGKDPGEFDGSSFKQPEHSYVFPWLEASNEAIYVVTFYYREQVKDVVYTAIDPMGQPIKLLGSEIEEHLDTLANGGYSIESQKEIKRWQVTKYIASGEMIIKSYPIAGENIPVVPTFGERAFVEGEEHWEGVTRLAKDPQRLRNFVMSYIGDISSRSPRSKPIFTAEQIQGFEYMYEENGADSNYPYLMQHRLSENGEPLPLGPVGMSADQPIPQSVAALVDLTRQAVEDVANPGLPQDIADPDLSGKAVIALQNRLDQQSLVYQQNLKHAKRRDAQIYASMASQVYDAPRRVTLTKPDGSRVKAQVMQGVFDSESGEVKMLNDLTNAEFDVFAEIGPSYSTKKEQTLEQLGVMAQAVAATDPALQKMLVLKQATLIDGVNFDDVREYANKQLIISGFKAPETDEEIAMMQQLAEQGQQPDAAMLLAMAEMEKAKADQMREQRQSVVDHAKIQTDQGKLAIDQFKAQTDRAKVQVDAKEAGANIRFTEVKRAGQQIDNVMKVSDQFRSRASVNQVANVNRF